jgi:hypothetical protein
MCYENYLKLTGKNVDKMQNFNCCSKWYIQLDFQCLQVQA